MAVGKYTATLTSEDSVNVDEAEAGGFGSEITETLKDSTGGEDEFIAGEAGDDADSDVITSKKPKKGIICRGYSAEV